MADWQKSYCGILTAREADDWFLSMMREHEEFEVETDRDGVAGAVLV